MNKEDFLGILKNRKYQWIAVGIIFLVVIIFAVYIRTQNLPLLHDSTTGKWLSSDIDPFYFLRVAETMLKGPLPAYDAMRYPALHLPFLNELLPSVLVAMYKTVNFFGGNLPIELISIIYPVVFFVLGIVAFFIFVLGLTKSKITALVSSSLLAFIPIFLYRTMAGVGDHEPLGFFGFFATLAFFVFFFGRLNEGRYNGRKELIIISLLLAFTSLFTAFTNVGWGGIANYLYMIIPFAFLVTYFLKFKQVSNLQEGRKTVLMFIGAFFVWIILTSILATLFGFSIGDSLNRFVFSPYGIISLLTGAFFVLDFCLIFLLKSEKIKKDRVFLSLGILIVSGILFSIVFNIDLLSSASNAALQLISPFSSERVGRTVAENQQPFLIDLISQVTSFFFWIFFIGVISIGLAITKNFNRKKDKVLFVLSWIFLVFAILFTRYSSSSTLNGNNFVSISLYIVSVLLFIVVSINIYRKDEIKLDPFLVIIFSWALFMLISTRASARIYFVIAPFFCFSAGYALLRAYYYASESSEEVSKLISKLVLVFVIVGLILSFYNFYGSSSTQAKYVGPSANTQWQEAMNWTRSQTPEGSIFVHWWDYGFWIQTLGQRPTVTDGAHGSSYWDHLIGRYVLTTPRPETALSYMKSNNVSYLLLDPSDIGKYPAYSSIGSLGDSEDRLDQMSVFLIDDKQTQEMSNITYTVLTGGAPIFDDIILNGKLLPKENTGLAAFVVSSKNDQIVGADAVLFSNGVQYRAKLSCVAYNNQVQNFQNSSLDGCLYLIPAVNNNKINLIGAGIWLDNKTFNSLFAQIYLFNGKLLPAEYKDSFVPAYFAQDPIVKMVKSQAPIAGNIIYYQGIRAPLQIWKINYPSEIIAHDEFLRPDGQYGEFDNFNFVK